MEKFNENKRHLFFQQHHHQQQHQSVGNSLKNKEGIASWLSSKKKHCGQFWRSDKNCRPYSKNPKRLFLTFFFLNKKKGKTLLGSSKYKLEKKEYVE